MAKAEHESASIILSGRNSFDLTCNNNDGSHCLAIEAPNEFGAGTNKESQDLMRTMMVAHLVAPKFPEKIETNFDFHFPELLYALYDYYGKKKPRILRTGERIIPRYQELTANADQISIATSHSGGLDSVYRIAKLLDQGETPLAVHLRNLNAKGNAYEALASREQCREWDVPYVTIQLRNSSGNSGFDTMKTRDLLLALAVAIQAAPHKTQEVLIEGGMGTDNRYHFSESAEVWSWFNKLLKDIGLDIEIVGIDPGDIETIGEVIELEKKLGISILPMVQNCFSAPFQVSNNRRKWEREAPNIAKQSAEHWCGSCHKCRRMTLGRIYYQDPKFSKVTQREIDFFVRDTYDWLKKYSHNSDLISKSFLEHLSQIK